MKKIAASLITALVAPLVFSVGALATNPDPLADNLSVTVNETCTFARTAGSGTYAVTMAVNKLNSSVGTSTFTAICNNPSGFSVAAVFTSITGTGAAITYSATTPSANSGTWTAYNSTADANIAATNGTLMTASGVTDAAGQAATVVYKIGTRNNQAKGAYSGTATYTLTQNT